jgi:hypothetical protein
VGYASEERHVPEQENVRSQCDLARAKSCEHWKLAIRCKILGPQDDFGSTFWSDPPPFPTEQPDDRVKLLHTLSTLPEHPESVPVNALVAVEGTPLEENPAVPALDMVRMIATARCIMPRYSAIPNYRHTFTLGSVTRTKMNVSTALEKSGRHLPL